MLNRAASRFLPRHCPRKLVRRGLLGVCWPLLIAQFLAGIEPAMAQGLRDARDLADPALKKVVDLRVSDPVAVTPPPFQPGQEIIYRVEVSNEGLHDSPETLIRIALPEGLMGGAWSCKPEPALGSLRLKQSFSNNSEIASGLYGASGLAFDPGGKSLWVAAGFDASLVQFSRGSGSEEWRARRIISGRDSVVPSMNGAAGIWISPDGGDLYLTGSLDNAVSQFRLDRGVGGEDLAVEPRLVHVLKQGIEGVDGLVGATNLTADPTGRFLYVAAPLSQAITTLARDAELGRLSYVGSFTNAEAGQQCLAGVNSLAVSNDGKFLYAAAYLDNSVIVCARDPATGGLKAVQLISYERGREDGLPLGEPYDLALSPDGRHLYVAAFSSDALLVFSRDPATGKLSHLETLMLTEDDEALASLDGPCAVAVSPDGMDVVVACQFSSTVMEFRRDPLTGKLRPLGEQREGQGSVYGLSGASGLAFSPDGATLAAAAGESSALHLFQKIRYMPQLSGGGDVRTRVDLAAGGKLVYTIRGQASPLGEMEMNLRARVDHGETIEDPNTGNNFAERTDRVVRPQAELRLTLVDQSPNVPAGENYELNMELANVGERDALGLELDLPLPPGVLGRGWSVVTSPGRHDLQTRARLMPPARVDPAAEPVEEPRESIAIDPAEEAKRAARKAQEAARIDAALTWLDAKLLTASPDGRHLYVLCANPARFVVFQRDLSSGAVGPVSVFPQRGEQLAELLLEDITRVAFTPEGEGMFALNPKNGSLALFRRDPLQGTLTLSTLWRDTLPGMAGLKNAADMALTADGRHVLVYQEAPAQLLRVSLLPSRPGMVLWQNAPPISLTAAAEGAPAPEVLPSTLANSRGPVMAVGRDARIVYVSSPALGGIAAFALPDLTDASAEPAAPLVEPVLGPKHAANIFLSPDETGLYVYERSSGLLHALRCDNLTGALRPALVAPAGLTVNAAGESAPDLALAFLARGNTLLIPREIEPGRFELTAASRNPATQVLTFPEIGGNPVGMGDGASQASTSGRVSALAVSSEGRDVYSLSAHDFSLQHLHDARPRILPSGLGRLRTRLDMPASSKANISVQLRISPGYRAEELLLAPRLYFENARDAEAPPLAQAESRVRVLHPALALLDLRVIQPPLEPGRQGKFEVRVRNDRLTPLLDSTLDARLTGRIRNPRWKSLTPAAAGQWRDLVTRPLRDADSSARTVDLALSPDEDRLFVLEADPSRLRVFNIDKDAFTLDEEEPTELPPSASGYADLETGGQGSYVFVLDRQQSTILTYALLETGKFELASGYTLSAELSRGREGRLDWDAEARELRLFAVDGADVPPIARFSIREASGALTLVPESDLLEEEEPSGPPDAASSGPAAAMATTHDNLMRFALSEDGNSLLTQRNSISNFTETGEGPLVTTVSLDGQSEVTFQIEGDIVSDALGFISLDASLYQGRDASRPETALPLDKDSVRWRLAPVADLRATLTAAGEPRLGEPCSFVFTIKNHGPSAANAIWLREGPLTGWKAAALPEHVALPQRVSSLEVGEERSFKFAFTPSGYLRPSGSDASEPLPLPARQLAQVLVVPATDGPAPGDNLATYTFPRPILDWSYTGHEFISRRAPVPIDAVLHLPEGTADPVSIHLQGPQDWRWLGVRIAPLRPGTELGHCPWSVELIPDDLALHPGRASAVLRPLPGETWTGGSVRVVLTGELQGLGTVPSSQLEPPLRLHAALEYTAPVYGHATSPATPPSLDFKVGRPNIRVAVAGKLPSAPANAEEPPPLTGSVPLVISNLQAAGVAPIINLNLLPQAPNGWTWTGAEPGDERLSLGSPSINIEGSDQSPLSVRVKRLLPGQSTVLWLHARRTETGGAGVDDGALEE